MELVYGISMVKNEADIILPTVLNMLNQVDHVIVADNLSTDSTRKKLETIESDRLTIIDDLDPAYYQSKKMTALAMLAMEEDASWVVPFDADEFWYSSFGSIADILRETVPEIAVVSATLYDHVPTAVDPVDDNPITRIGWRRVTPGPLPKVACRAKPSLVIEQGNHDATYDGIKVAKREGAIVIRHYPYRTAAQMAGKAVTGSAALSYTDLPESSGQHWRDYARLIGSIGEPGLEEVFMNYFWSADPVNNVDLIFDPAPAS